MPARKIVPYSVRRKHNVRRKATAPEKEVHEWLRELGIPFKREKQISQCHVDVFIEPDIVIEIHGCYWHAHTCLRPKKGWPPEKIEIRKRDAARYEFLRSQGYQVVVIWECDITERPEQVLARLRRLKAKQ